MSSLESYSLLPDYSMKPLVTHVYTHNTTIPSDAPSSPNEPSPAASSSLDVSTFPCESSIPIDLSSSAEPFFPATSTPEPSLRSSHRLHQPNNWYSPATFVATALPKPTSYHDAILHQEWQHVMVEEITALERTSTWELVPCPPRVRPITCKWVYKVKIRSDSSLERYKAQLVACGFQ
jgi:hypothetical protein